MKIEIKIFLALFILLFYIESNAQFSIEANPSVLNAELLYNSTVQVGEFSFEYSQGGELKSFDSEQPVKMTICFMNVMPSNGIESIQGDLAQYFEWIYIENINCLRGVQKEIIEDGKKPGRISLVVKAKGDEPLEDHTNIGFITNLQPAPKMNQTNKTEDDAISEYQKVALVKNLIIAEIEKN